VAIHGAKLKIIRRVIAHLFLTDIDYIRLDAVFFATRAGTQWQTKEILYPIYCEVIIRTFDCLRFICVANNLNSLT